MRRMGEMGFADEQERLMREEAEEQNTTAAWFALGDFYNLRDDYDAAVTAFAQALKAGPNPAPMVKFAYADTLIQAQSIGSRSVQLRVGRRPVSSSRASWKPSEIRKPRRWRFGAT
jgi:tetratricopeptide (TPR) repeat protein